ncbi:hypothetical protein C8Q76DRAFT_277324 [Earliella scabrosa]|nr:hypothetical protein C8Q76DRAFT_277324 [Earliella scabrosa]
MAPAARLRPTSLLPTWQVLARAAACRVPDHIPMLSRSTPTQISLLSVAASSRLPSLACGPTQLLWSSLGPLSTSNAAEAQLRASQRRRPTPTIMEGSVGGDACTSEYLAVDLIRVPGVWLKRQERSQNSGGVGVSGLSAEGGDLLRPFEAAQVGGGFCTRDRTLFSSSWSCAHVFIDSRGLIAVFSTPFALLRPRQRELILFKQSRSHMPPRRSP